MIPPFQKMPGLTVAAEQKLAAVGSRQIWERVKQDIENGYAKLYALPNETYIVLRIDRNELVVVALVGSRACDAMDLACAIAKCNGLDTVRFHTVKKGLPRLLKKYGPVKGETTYRVPVK